MFVRRGKNKGDVVVVPMSAGHGGRSYDGYVLQLHLWDQLAIRFRAYGRGCRLGGRSGLYAYRDAKAWTSIARPRARTSPQFGLQATPIDRLSRCIVWQKRSRKGQMEPSVDSDEACSTTKTRARINRRLTLHLSGCTLFLEEPGF